jgi:hypothetical protein
VSQFPEPQALVNGGRPPPKPSVRATRPSPIIPPASLDFTIRVHETVTASTTEAHPLLMIPPGLILLASYSVVISAGVSKTYQWALAVDDRRPNDAAAVATVDVIYPIRSLVTTDTRRLLWHHGTAAVAETHNYAIRNPNRRLLLLLDNTDDASDRVFDGHLRFTIQP